MKDSTIDTECTVSRGNDHVRQSVGSYRQWVVIEAMPGTVREICDETGYSEDDVRDSIDALRRAGRPIGNDDSQWATIFGYGLPRRRTFQDRVLEALPGTTADLAKATELNLGQVQQALMRLREKGFEIEKKRNVDSRRCTYVLDQKSTEAVRHRLGPRSARQPESRRRKRGQRSSPIND